MLVWIDLANSPHVPLLEPVVSALRDRGDRVLLTARDHAQTVALARQRWPEVRVLGGQSPGGRAAKALSIGTRAATLQQFARSERPDVALSHGSYAQIMAARVARVPAVTMMDYEYQPANHLSFRLAKRVIVPDVFPSEALRRFGAKASKVVRYAGFKEELYLMRREPDLGVLDELGLDPARVIAVFRPPPEGALYHQMGNERFDEVLEDARSTARVQIVLLPRTSAQAMRYGHGVIVPEQPIDASSLLALADMMVGAGGTMNRESALLGTPTYTVFAGRQASVDAALIRAGKMHDLRKDSIAPRFEKRSLGSRPTSLGRGDAILAAILSSVSDLAAS